LVKSSTSFSGCVYSAPGRVEDSLGWNWVSSGRAQVGRSLKFCVFVIWQVQDILDSCSTRSAVLYIESLLFSIKKKEVRKKKGGRTAF
jgi:hypothetical protein